MLRLTGTLAVVVLAQGFGLSSAFAETPPLFAGTGPAESSYADPLPATVAVSTYAPPACAAKPCPLLIAIHGMGRNARGARDAWKAAADRGGFLVLAPRFDKEQFSSRRFQQGNARGEPDKAKWTFGLIERLFDVARASGRVAGGSYTIFGHSAGAQFVHRMVMLMPDARIATAAVANAGYYTLPVLAGERAYPYSLKGTPAVDATLAAALSKPMLVMLGDRDTDPDHPQLNKSRGAEEQGPTRFARGEHFMAAARDEARRLGVTLRWREVVVPGVAHQQSGMAEAAGAELFGVR
ncbi:alpha/beta hydrolase-fold protein [Bosea robiniae]|jgi:poly(3-hydroxybutyrate) depolymerase|uniref:Esterase n=1 Tax=Bosea robiniae TaxID=1036780 RepID=A0ABY0NGD5_9HYPH|nr:alpha/beta hydrolase-fold protein [Bosea robiniae]SDF43287.1 Putative esterase [Bosea robiniae]